MGQKIVINAQVNIRSAAGEILGTTLQPKTVESNETIVRDGVVWHTFIAYVRSDMVKVLDKKSMYVSQINGCSAGDGARRNDCGLACVSMMRKNVDGVCFSVKKLSELFDVAQDGTTNNDLVQAGTTAGIALQANTFKAGDTLPATPHIALVNYGGFNRAGLYVPSFTGWHWVIYVSEDSRGVIINDPLYPDDDGENRRVTHDEWRKAFVPYGGYFFTVGYATKSTMKQIQITSPRNDSPFSKTQPF